MNYTGTYRIFPLGDSAITIDFGNCIEQNINTKVISLFYYLQKNPLEGMIETVPAYSSLTVYYDVFNSKMKNTSVSAYDFMKRQLEKILVHDITAEPVLSNHIRIPVLYDGEDIEWVAQEKNLSVKEVIRIHSGAVYRVYMLGFLPGFPYMGETNERINVPRKQQPRLKVEEGSVGIAGRQTGIYPLASPGGWQLIGKTPLKIFDAKRKPLALISAGDTVQFYPISKDEFENY